MKNSKLKLVVKSIWRTPLILTMKQRLKNHNFTIISSNCIGGTLYHDCGEEFLSPTINMSFRFPDFIKFLENLSYYISIPVTFSHMNVDENYPICKLDDIEIKGVHYKDFNEFSKAWEKRVTRINFDNLYIIATDREGATPDLLNRFSKLPYKKICFVSTKLEGDEFIYVPGFEKEGEVGDLTRYADIWGRRLFEKYHDCIEWLNDM